MKRLSRATGQQILLIALSLVSLYPLWFIVQTACKTPQAYTLDPTGLPGAPTLQNFLDVFRVMPFGRWTLNSALVAMVSVCAATAIALFAAYYHAGCDEYLFVLSGRGTFWMEDASTEAAFGPGELLFFERGTVHAIPSLSEEPVIFLSLDTPRRDPQDIIFVNPEDGSPATFLARNAG
jgi:mannose-6-phosphate isomerase-like protein (cupin superfamily)